MTRDGSSTSSAGRSWDQSIRQLRGYEVRILDAYLSGVFPYYTWGGHEKCEAITCGWSDIRSAYNGSELAHYHADPQPHYTHCREPRRDGKGGCHERREYLIAYSYGAGRGGTFRGWGGMAGRSSRTEREVCAKHAQTFAKKHGIDVVIGRFAESAVLR